MTQEEIKIQESPENQNGDTEDTSEEVLSDSNVEGDQENCPEACQEDNLDAEEKDTQEKIDELTNQAEQMKELAQRTQAEFMNYKKRTAKEKQDLSIFANEKIMTDLITVVDNFERALDAVQDKEDPFYKGVDLIRKQLVDTLGKYGLEEIQAQDQDFDPNVHHAVVQEDADTPGKVLEVLQKGYKLRDKVIRASMVKVSK